MTGFIFRKELAYHITTPRVLIFFIISTSLFIINGLTFVGNYKYDLETYSEVQANNWTGRNTAGAGVITEPGRLEFCVQGGAHIRPRTLFINLDDTIRSAMRSQYENFKLPDVRRIDWSFIIQTVYALFCVVLTFDAISGERARGTLRLMMANSVSRAQILLGKYLAVLVIVLVVLLIGCLLSLAVMNLLSVTVPKSADITPLLLFALLSVFYISLFISMSLLASSLAKTSSTASVWPRRLRSRRSRRSSAGSRSMDVEAGKRIGCKTILVLSGKSRAEDVEGWKYKPDYIKKDLAEAVNFVIRSGARSD